MEHFLSNDNFKCMKNLMMFQLLFFSYCMLSIGCNSNTINKVIPGSRSNVSVASDSARSDSQRSLPLSRLEQSSRPSHSTTSHDDKSNGGASANGRRRRKSEVLLASSNNTHIHPSCSNLLVTSLDLSSSVHTGAVHSFTESLKLQLHSQPTVPSIDLFQPNSKSQKQQLENLDCSKPSASVATTTVTTAQPFPNAAGIANPTFEYPDGRLGEATQKDAVHKFSASGDGAAIETKSPTIPVVSQSDVDRVSAASIVAQVKKRKNGGGGSADEEGDHSPPSMVSASMDQQSGVSASATAALLATQVSPIVDKVLRDTVYDALFVTSNNMRHLNLVTQTHHVAAVDSKNFTFQAFDPFKTSAMAPNTLLTHTSNSWEVQTFKHPNQFHRPSFLPMKDAEIYEEIFEPGDETLKNAATVPSYAANTQQRTKESSLTSANFGSTTPVKIFPTSKVNTAMTLGSSEPALSSPRAQSSPPWINYLSSRPPETAGSSERNGPPSPPLSRKHAVHAGSPTMLGSGNHEKYVELLTQYNTLKKQLVELEDKVKLIHGQSMTENEVSKLPEYRTLMTQITKIRNQLKEWKSGGDQSDKFSWTSESMKENMRDSGVNLAKLQHMKEVMLTATERLAEKRREANRPYEISQMSDVDIKIEKEQTQKELLNFEKLFGRVKTKEERQIATALYDRYRALKKLSKSAHYSKSTPSTVDSDITDINSDFGDNNSAGRSPAVAVYVPGVTSEAIPSPVPEESSRLTLKDLEIEKSMLLDRKRKLSKSVNSVNRSIHSFKQQADVNELKKVKARLKQIEHALSSNTGSSGTAK